MTGVSASPTALVGLRPEPASGLGHSATITNAERDRLARKYCLLLDRHEARRKGPVGRRPWAYLAGLGKALGHVRNRIDAIDIARINERKAA